MPVIAVINRKGGSGKSTLAAHLAAWLAHQGHAVMLGDIDRQQSSRVWLRNRNAALPPVASWLMDQKNVLRVPAGIHHAVLDTPGGLHGFELARLVMVADAILIPVCPSIFDRESAATCHAELTTLPRVASGRCRLACVGMRVDSRTHGADTLREWADALKLPFLGALRETQLYVRCLEKGMTIFDLSESLSQIDRQQWAPILDWLKPVFAPAAAACVELSAPQSSPAALRPPKTRATPPAPGQPDPPAPPVGQRAASLYSGHLQPAQQSIAHGSRLSTIRTAARPSALPHVPARGTLSRPSALSADLDIPQFLRVKPERRD